MIKPTKNRRKAIIGTVLFHIGLLLCFIFMGLTYQIPPPNEEGINIDFGYQDFGSGSEQSEQIVEEQEITPQEIVDINLLLKILALRKLKKHLQPNLKNS